jgi:hypothetical protein
VAGPRLTLTLPKERVNSPERMTNDQFPNLNSGDSSVHVVADRSTDRGLDWSLAIGIWSFCEIIRERVREFSALRMAAGEACLK